jgi:hypothetical protein
MPAMRVLVVLAVLSVAALSTSSEAGSASVRVAGRVTVGIKGWGAVTPGKGFTRHRSIVCRRASCRSKSVAAGRAHRVTLRAKPYKGWKLAGWHGACKGTRPACTIHLTRKPVVGGARRASVKAVFVAVAPGLTRKNPIPLGQTAAIGGGFEWRINSFTPAVQLSPPAPAGKQYAVANVTATFVGGGGNATGQPASVVQNNFDVSGGQNAVYSWGQCPVGPEPDLSQDPRVLSPGQSATGNVCWEIASSDAASLKAEITHWNPSGATTWFALH